MTPEDIDCMFRQILLKDMRTQCRLRGISPAGGKEQLAERLKENMLATKDFSLKNESGEDLVINAVAGTASTDVAKGFAQNNYMRPSGQQNVGNFITDRASSRVLAPPGGATTICFGDASTANAPESAPSPRNRRDMPLSPAARAGLPAGLPPPGALTTDGAALSPRPEGLTEVRPGAKVPGGTAGGNSQIIFG
ncbi:hypothetical protein MNEG_1902 [Monoraphidium neglectum]|uniref:SAP domain-containing protein n=1 Tax=Monoraphidium neglectum TaxID=145388 RepID=A0A0D2MU16_9CHLO|nr:hypothetical protein MNEG_1902 [Monoraphidium neglectum]KIZ06055.1 hypothetical protein MNEG_1902 [Monoraphidium neglectum]|eukprot:XP_013905074.1 hypothetical protein MNEG_1902 [Monoraphidium neglectum]